MEFKNKDVCRHLHFGAHLRSQCCGCSSLNYAQCSNFGKCCAMWNFVLQILQNTATFFSPNLSNLPPFENFVHCGNLLQFCAMAMFCKLCAIWRFCTCYAMWHFLREVAIFCTFCTMHMQEKCIHNTTKLWTKKAFKKKKEENVLDPDEQVRGNRGIRGSVGIRNDCRTQHDQQIMQLNLQQVEIGNLQLFTED